MKIFTNEAARSIDARSIESGATTSMQLIEQVAELATAEIVKRWKPSRPTAVFAGPGNNGADALAVARLLVEQGFKPRVFLFNIGGNRLSAECKTSRDMLLAAAPVIDFNEITHQFKLPELSRNWLVIDGIFGSGLRDALTGGFQFLVRGINESHATVVSLDVPSGLHGDWNPQAVNRNIIHADLTLAIGFPGIALFISDNAPLVGEWKVLNIGLNPEVIMNTETAYYYVEKHDIKPILAPRYRFASKADFGSMVLIAGSYGMAGASVMGAMGALRSGVGKVTVHGPRCAMNVVQTATPEAMFEADRGDEHIVDIKLRHQYDAAGIGPGMGTDPATVDAIERFITSQRRPIVIDADALNAIASRPTMLNHLPASSIITPHAGEFDRLFGNQPSAEARLLKAIEVSRHYNIIVVLKGHYTATIRPDGKVYFNSSGTVALATPGSGDVLTGIITSFLAQGMKPEVAAVTGVYVHGIAGRISALDNGEYGVTAGDIARCTGRAILEINSL